MRQSDFLQSLQQDLDDLSERMRTFILPLEKEQLNWRPAAEKWSAAEVLAHLNSYCDYYLPEIEKALKKASPQKENFEGKYKSTWLGRYIIKSMSPETIAKKASAPKQHNHLNSQIRQDVVEHFLTHQSRFRNIIEQAKTIDINKAKVRIEIAKFLKLRLGDIFKFMMVHQQRHMIQIMNNEQLRKNKM